jgi:anti-sigma regulatory factor (Ser/Thr protein kinase)
MVPDVIVLPVSDGSAKAARDWVAKIAIELWQLDDYIPRLVVSELVTNAVRHSQPDQQVIVRAYTCGGRHTCEVWDQNPALPAMREADATHENGRGLFLLSQLVARWGTRPLSPPGTGKIVYVEFA